MGAKFEAKFGHQAQWLVVACFLAVDREEAWSKLERSVPGQAS